MAVLKATRRSQTGSRRTRRLRREGQIPGIIYGHGEDPEPISLHTHDVEVVILRGERLLEIDLEGKTQNALIKEVQYDTFGHDVLHMDLARVDLDERVEVTIPVVLRGTPAGVDQGGVLQQVGTSVTIETLVRAIPEDIRLMIGEMNVGDILHIGDLPLPEGAKLLDDPDGVVCSVTMVAEEVEAAPEEEALPEPEVIGEVKEEEEEGKGKQTSEGS